jgi:hypothetical protein
MRLTLQALGQLTKTKQEKCYWCDRPASSYRRGVYEAVPPAGGDKVFAWCSDHDHEYQHQISYDEYIVLKVMDS